MASESVGEEWNPPSESAEDGVEEEEHPPNVKGGGKEKAFICSFENCNKTFRRRDKLRDHIYAHTNERMYPCLEEGCGRSYTRSQHLKRHMRSHLGIAPEKNIRCIHENCDGTFSTNQNLKKHLDRVHNSDRYKCTMEGCREQFRKMHQLKAHMYTHLGVLPYQCFHRDCLKKFTQKSHLVRHLKTHDGYPCPILGCSEVLKTWSLLRRHKAVAHAMSYTCEYCGKVFIHRGNFNVHVEGHTESVVPIPCTFDYCGRTFPNRRSLRSHIQYSHKGYNFICSFPGCHREFTSKKRLETHQPLHDPNRSPPQRKPRMGIPKIPILDKLNEFIVSSEAHFHLEPSSHRQEDEREQEQPEFKLLDTSSQDGLTRLKEKTRWRSSYSGVCTVSQDSMEAFPVVDFEHAGIPQAGSSSGLDLTLPSKDELDEINAVIKKEPKDSSRPHSVISDSTESSEIDSDAEESPYSSGESTGVGEEFIDSGNDCQNISEEASICNGIAEGDTTYEEHIVDPVLVESDSINNIGDGQSEEMQAQQAINLMQIKQEPLSPPPEVTDCKSKHHKSSLKERISATELAPESMATCDTSCSTLKRPAKLENSLDKIISNLTQNKLKEISK